MKSAKTCSSYKKFLEAEGELKEEVKINLAFITMEEELMVLRTVGPHKSTNPLRKICATSVLFIIF